MRFTMRIPRAHTRPPNQNHRECGLKICMLNKQVILLKVYEPLLQGESTQREALAEECDFGGRGIRAKQWGRNILGGPEVVRVKTGVCPQWYLLQSPVVDGIWPAASGSPLYLRSSYGVSLFLLYWRSANGMGADLPFLGQHCNYEAAQRRGWRCLARCEGGWCALQCSLGSSQLIFHCCYTAENGLESIFLPTSSLLSPNPNAYFLC